MIIATAGHVDHGKTTLLQAITGVNADRLPEEKARGMTIDLGYAYWPQPDGRVLGFIDVPGHEKFLSNMLAGVGGIDHALLVVACDDGVMAQTREHLAILQLTGKPTLTVALTKTDRVAAARVEEVRAEVEQTLRELGFDAVAFFPTAAAENIGIAELRSHLLQLAEPPPPAAAAVSPGAGPCFYRQRRGAGGHRDGALRRSTGRGYSVAHRRQHADARPRPACPESSG
ncbi:hypothetical protein BN1200_40042 [Klebsiella variicola]|nr:hypothetical protein BN1200_40042 [Klebsiella variicola]